MFDITSIGNFASIFGVVLAVAVAIYQRGAAVNAEERARAEKQRAATLEDHLARQRWQQLRSLGEQIDALEENEHHTADATSAALHARLREQYRSVLGVIATSTPSFSAALLRHWVYTGRLPRPWQVEEALSHIERSSSRDDVAEDEEWLKRVIYESRTSPGPHPKKLQFPLELNEYVAAFILVAASVEDHILEIVKEYGQSTYSLAVLLNHLAEDCITKNKRKIGPVHLRAWGWDQEKTFEERFRHYEEIDFWVVYEAADSAQEKLRGYGEYFQSLHGLSEMIVPTEAAITSSMEEFPSLAETAATFLNKGTEPDQPIETK